MDIYSAYKSNSQYRLVYLHSSPLNLDSRIPMLEIQEEIKAIKATLEKSNRQIYFQAEVATPQNLKTILILGAIMIHYSGHGKQGSLAFENGYGQLQELGCDMLKSLFQAGSPVPTKVVFVSACHSESPGNTFAQAGVPHVIAVKDDCRVSDQASRTFANFFYLSIVRGATVLESFNTATQMVRIEQQTDEEMFLLLPKGADHNVRIFENVPRGMYHEETKPLAPNNCDSVPWFFVGRNREMSEIYLKFSHRCRFVTITGPRGIGKTTTALKVCSHMNERRLFESIFFVPLGKLWHSYLSSQSLNGKQEDNYFDVIAEIFGRCMGHAAGGQIKTFENLITLLEHPAYRSMPLLFVLDGCDDFCIQQTNMNIKRAELVPQNASPIPIPFVNANFNINDVQVDTKSTTNTDGSTIMSPISLESPMSPVSSVQSVEAIVEAVAVESTKEEDSVHHVALIEIIDMILQRTEGVKFLCTSTYPLQDAENMNSDVIFSHEPEKVVRVDKLTSFHSAELLIKLAPRSLKASEMNTHLRQEALRALSEREIVKDLEGNPRVIHWFVKHLNADELNDSPEMRQKARDVVNSMKDYREKTHHHPALSNQMSVGAPPLPPQQTSSHFSPKSTKKGKSSKDLGSRSSDQLLEHDIFSPPPRLHTSKSVNNMNTSPNPAKYRVITAHVSNSPNVKPVILRDMDSAREVAFKVIADPICAELWANLTASPLSKQGSRAPPTKYVKWNHIVNELADSLTKLSACDTPRGGGGGGRRNSTHHIRTLVQNDVNFLRGKIRLESPSPTSDRGIADAIVTLEAFRSFSAWWSSVLKTIKLLGSDYFQTNPYLVHGFYTRLQTEQMLLEHQAVGMFMLRFSESHPGCLAVSMTDVNDHFEVLEPEKVVESCRRYTIRHCLIEVTPEGFSIFFERGQSRYPTLRDLILNCASLLTLYPGIPKQLAFGS